MAVPLGTSAQAVSAARAHFLLKNPKQHSLSRASFGAVTTIIPTSFSPHKSLWVVAEFCSPVPIPTGVRQLLSLPKESPGDSGTGKQRFSGLRSQRGLRTGSRVGDDGAGSLQGAGSRTPPAFPSPPFPARLLPARGPGTLSGVLGAGLGAQPGPTGSQPTPVGSSGARPASQVWPLARGLPPGESSSASLDAAAAAGEGRAALPERTKPPGVDGSTSTPFGGFLSFTGGSQIFFPAGVWNPRAFLCRTGWVQEQPCPRPTRQYSPACPTPSPCPESPPPSFPLLPFPDQSCLPSLYCKHYLVLR